MRRKSEPLDEVDGVFFERETQATGRRLGYHPYSQTLFLEIPRVSMIASSNVETDYETDGNPQFVRDRYVIEGDAVFVADRPRRLGFISAAGIRPYTGKRLTVQIAGFGEPIGDQHSTLWFWPEHERDRDTDESENRLYLSVHVSNERLAWLWNAILQAPTARLFLHVDVPLYQHEVDYHLSEGYHTQELFLRYDEREADTPRTKLSSIDFVVSTRDGHEREADDVLLDGEIGTASEAPPVEPKPDKLSTSPAVIPRWVLYVALALLAVNILIFLKP